MHCLILLLKIKTGLSFQQFASFLNQNSDEGRQTVSLEFRSIISELDANFYRHILDAHKHLGKRLFTVHSSIFFVLFDEKCA